MRFYRFLAISIVAPIILLSCGEAQDGRENTTIISSQPSNTTSNNHYVALTGSDVSGDGTFERPWQTVHHALKLMPRDKSRLTLNLREGAYPLATALLIDEQYSGSERGVFTIRSQDGENAVLDGSLIFRFGAMVSIRNASYVTLENLELTNLVGNKTGIHVTGASENITISNNKIHNMHWTTDASAASVPEPADNLNPVAIVGDSAEPIKQVTVTGNKVFNLTTGYSEAIKIVGNVDGFLITKNEVYDVSNIGIVAAGNYAWVGLQEPHLNQARNGVIRDNEVYRCVSPVAASAGIYVDGARDITVINNNSHHNTVGFSVGSEEPGVASNVALTNNVASDNIEAGVVIGTISANSMVDHVTLSGNEIHGNYTSPAWGGGPIIINKSKNISIEENKIHSISQYMITVNAVSENLKLNKNQYESTAVSNDKAVFSWVGIDSRNYIGFENYKSTTGQDALSTFNSSDGSIFSSILNSVKKRL